jgi:epoxyqueuosine reductase
MLTNEIVVHEAKRLGFSLVGFAKAETLPEEMSRLQQWLQNGQHAGMAYMERNLDKREDVRKILSSAKSVISLGMNYYTDHTHSGNPKMGKISRYAWGKDYHLLMWEKLAELISELKERHREFEAMAYVDTGPVMDKVWAVKSGIGWMGKNGNIINRSQGSWFFIATILTNADFKYGSPIDDFCGACTACLDACPTNAFAAPYVVDANRCISYLTIENKDEIPEGFSGQFDSWLFGCDTCQDVCPWNKKFAEPASQSEFAPVGGKTEFEPAEFIAMDAETFKLKFAESPMKRAKLTGMQRNARFLLTGGERHSR